MANATTNPQSILFDPQGGILAYIQFVAEATDGWFFVMMLGILGLVVLFSAIPKWGFDWSFFGTAFGVMIVSLPIWLAGGLDDRSLFLFILLFALSVVKVTVFKR